MKSMKKKIKFLSLAGLLTGLIVLASQYFQKSGGDLVKKVIDGDTVIMESGERLRYIGIDTPEEEQLFYKQARKFNQRLVERKNVRLEFDVQVKDRYGRLLAYVYVDTIFVNAELVKNGLAVTYTYPPNVKHQELFLKLQKQARNKKIGIWSLPQPKKEKKYYAKIGSRRFHRPKCFILKEVSDYEKIKFDSREKALDEGYSPCRICKP